VSDRPVIGITASVETVTAGPWVFEAAHSPLAYVRAVQRAGGDPVILVPDPGSPERAARRVLERIDAVVLAGGAGDVDPALYGARAHPETVPDADGRDAFEAALVGAAAETDRPLLGICRGMQLLTAALGGRLVQHLPDVLAEDGHRSLPAEFADHEVELEPGSLAARATGATRLSVKSHHHQGVADAGPRLRPTGRATHDGTLEAVEDPRRRFLLGVLWHPEEDEASRVIGSLVEACRTA
jgi:putative glutamine amidotransferase